MPSSVADLAALGKLFEQHRPRLLAMVERRIDSALAARVGADDILNDAFLEARRKWDRFHSQSQLTGYAWLYRITLDMLIESWRKHSRGPRNVDRDMPLPERSSMQLGLGLVDSGTSPSAALAKKELAEQVRQTVDTLKETDRQVLWMRHADQLSHEEIGMVLGISENAAMVRYTRALKRFKELWQRISLNRG
jgi:RNA polymerase sigma-70 factor (ECF subfamily)